MNHLRILLATLVVAATYPLSASPPAPAQDIRALMQRVNAWQLAHTRMKADDRNWERGAWYAGVTEAQRAAASLATSAPIRWNKPSPSLQPRPSSSN